MDGLGRLRPVFDADDDGDDDQSCYVIRGRSQSWNHQQRTNYALLQQQPRSLVSSATNRGFSFAAAPPGHKNNMNGTIGGGGRGAATTMMIRRGDSGDDSIFFETASTGGDSSSGGGGGGGKDNKNSTSMSMMTMMQNSESAANQRKRRKSYTELIATAILSSPSKKLTLAEIYDWMASNVDEYRDQRYAPSSSSWKNAVRHNLSVQSCFKRVKRHGVEKPSWWTVDKEQAAKRRLSISTATITNNGRSKPQTISAVDGSLQNQQQQQQQLQARSAVVVRKRTSFDEALMTKNGLLLRSVLDKTDLPNNNSGVNYYSPQSTATNNVRISKNEDDRDLMLLSSNGNGGSVFGKRHTVDEYNVCSSFDLESSEQSAEDGGVQTVRVKTAHGVEQNVRFFGPLRANVVVNCEIGVQTSEQDHQQQQQNDYVGVETKNTNTIITDAAAAQQQQLLDQVDNNYFVQQADNELLTAIGGGIEGKVIDDLISMTSTNNQQIIDEVMNMDAGASSLPMEAESDNFAACWTSYLNTDPLPFTSVA